MIRLKILNTIFGWMRHIPELTSNGYFNDRKKDAGETAVRWDSLQLVEVINMYKKHSILLWLRQFLRSFVSQWIS